MYEYDARAGKAHNVSKGAVGGNVGMLEVLEAEVAKSITEMATAERGIAWKS